MYAWACVCMCVRVPCHAGFNPGSTLLISNATSGIVSGRAAVCTTLSGAAGGLACMLNAFRRQKAWDLVSLCNGCLVGFVSITANCHVVEPWAAIICGFFGGLVSSRFVVSCGSRCIDTCTRTHTLGCLDGLTCLATFVAVCTLYWPTFPLSTHTHTHTRAKNHASFSQLSCKVDSCALWAACPHLLTHVRTHSLPRPSHRLHCLV